MTSDSWIQGVFPLENCMLTLINAHFICSAYSKLLLDML